jgi:hypothetical protein
MRAVKLAENRKGRRVIGSEATCTEIGKNGMALMVSIWVPEIYSFWVCIFNY